MDGGRQGETIFGCHYCADYQNFHFGHVTQIGFSEERHLILLRCPRCDTLYENTPDGEDRIRRLTVGEAKQFYQLHPGYELPAKPN